MSDATITIRRPEGRDLGGFPDWEFEALITEAEWMRLAQVKRSQRVPCPLSLIRRHSSLGDPDPVCICCSGHGRALDHGAIYVRDRKPVVIVAQPYSVDADCLDEIERWRTAGLYVGIHARSWHFPGHTVRVEVWAPNVRPLIGDDYGGTHGEAEAVMRDPEAESQR